MVFWTDLKNTRKVRQMLLFLILATKAGSNTGSNNSDSSQEANLALSETRSV